jgi:hypothetical protein
MWIAAYALARCGVRNTSSGPARPPVWFGNINWGEAYERFFASLGDGRTLETFKASLQNARDKYDPYVGSGRTGWVNHKTDHKPYPLTGLSKKVFDEWSSRSDDELKAAALALSTDGIFAPTSDIELLIGRTREAREKLKASVLSPTGNKKPAKLSAVVESFVRDPRVRAFVLNLADGRCEACEMLAPFEDAYGDLFLEVHHLNFLANGGSDTVENAVAVCPNCHRRLHYSIDREAYRTSIQRKLSRLPKAGAHSNPRKAKVPVA